MPLEIFGDFSFVGGEDTTANPFQDRQTCINWYPEISPSKGAKVAASLLGCPGLIQLATAGPTLPPLGNSWPQPSTVTNLPVRGSWVLPGAAQALVVIASTCYLVSILSPGSSTIPGKIALTKVGTLNSSVGPVSIRDNGIGGFAILVDGPNGYLYNIASGVFSKITDPNFLGSNLVAYIDGWWIFNVPGTQTFYTNASQFSTAFNASLFAQKDAASDKLMGHMESKEELWLIGEKTTEIWYDAGGQFFAFQRLVGTMLQVGCKATYSIARLSTAGQDGLIWFGRSDRGENVVVKTKGFIAEVVSTPAVSDAIAQYPITSDAIGYTYQDDTHEFYVLTFPAADRTWVYDASMPPELAWHQRLSYDPYAAAFHRHRSNCYMNFAGMRIVGDYQNGSLYQLTRSAYTDAGWPILARRRSPHIWDKESRGRVFMSSLQVDFAPGQGAPSGLGQNPQAYLTLSRDGGASLGSAYAPGPIGNTAPMGAIGQTRNRTMWRKLSWTRDSVPQVDVIAPVNRDITGATLRASGE
jgi:hypothetical protein